MIKFNSLPGYKKKGKMIMIKIVKTVNQVALMMLIKRLV